MEDGLGLLRPPLRRDRFVDLLQGFLAFHQAWEPRMAGLLGEAAFPEARRRMTHIRNDLRGLRAPDGPAGAAHVDLGFLTTPSAAWGSLYVMEGSTLGGQVISKALSGAAWAPAGGLTYFNPHGRRTAAMWAGFCSTLEAHAPSLDAAAAIDGACATFRALRLRLAGPLEAAA